MAEFYIGQPLFTGQSSEQQFLKIMQILGTPTPEELQDMQLTLLPNLPQIKGKGLESVIKNADPQFIELLKCLLNYAPSKRTRAFRLLAHPFFDSLRTHKLLVNGNPVVNLFDFNETEIGQDKDLIDKLRPSWQ